MQWDLVLIFFIFVKPYELNGEIGAATPMNKLRRNLILIKEDCGDVCDTSDKFSKVAGIYFNQIVKNIQCEYLFESPQIENNTDVSEQQLKNKPPLLSNLPKEIQQQYTFDGRIPILHNYINDIDYLQKAEKKAQMKIIRDKLWERKSIEIDQKLFRNNKLFGAYGREVVLDMTKLIKEYMIEQVQNGHVLVIGSQSPWIETILIELGAAKITTLEYDVIRTDHPKASFPELKSANI